MIIYLAMKVFSIFAKVFYLQRVLYLLVMSTSREYSDEEIREMSKKEFRKKLPSGWMEVTKNESIVLTIDALLDSSPNREFTKKEIADRAGLTKKSVGNHIDDLVELGVVEHLENRSPERYRLNDNSPIIQKIRQLDSVVQRVKSGDLQESVTEPLSRDNGDDYPHGDYQNPVGDEGSDSDGIVGLDERSVNDRVDSNTNAIAPMAN